MQHRSASTPSRGSLRRGSGVGALRLYDRQARGRRSERWAESAEELADRIGDDVHALRDRVSGQPTDPPTAGGINRPQDAWDVLVPLANVPGRLANVLRSLVSYLRRGAGDFPSDGELRS